MLSSFTNLLAGYHLKRRPMANNRTGQNGITNQEKKDAGVGWVTFWVNEIPTPPSRS